MWDHRCHWLQFLGSLQSDITPGTYTDTSGLSHLPEDLSPAQGFQGAVPRAHTKATPTVGIAAPISPFLLTKSSTGMSQCSVTPSCCISTAQKQQLESSSTCSGRDWEPQLLQSSLQGH